MLVYEQFAIASVERAVQRRSVHTDLGIPQVKQGGVESKSIPDLGGHGITDALFVATFRYLPTRWVAKGNANSHPRPYLAHKDTE
jgi:hypothetical protein